MLLHPTANFPTTEKSDLIVLTGFIVPILTPVVDFATNFPKFRRKVKSLRREGGIFGERGIMVLCPGEGGFGFEDIVEEKGEVAES